MVLTGGDGGMVPWVRLLLDILAQGVTISRSPDIPDGLSVLCSSSVDIVSDSSSDFPSDISNCAISISSSGFSVACMLTFDLFFLKILNILNVLLELFSFLGAESMLSVEVCLFFLPIATSLLNKCDKGLLAVMGISECSRVVVNVFCWGEVMSSSIVPVSNNWCGIHWLSSVRSLDDFSNDICMLESSTFSLAKSCGFSLAESCAVSLAESCFTLANEFCSGKNVSYTKMSAQRGALTAVKMKAPKHICKFTSLKNYCVYWIVY